MAGKGLFPGSASVCLFVCVFVCPGWFGGGGAFFPLKIVFPKFVSGKHGEHGSIEENEENKKK